MAVALPDALPPIQGNVADIQSQSNESGSFTYQQYTVHLIGNELLDAGVAQRVTRDAASLSDVVRNISSELYRSGYPAAQVHYALDGQDLYVLTLAGEITEVTGDSRVTHYFSDLAGSSPTRDTDFERARSLAKVHAKRAGENVKPVLQPDPAQPGKSALHLKTKAGEPDPVDIRGEFGNPGNRFVGRHFLKLDLDYGLPSGDQFSATWNAGLAGLNDRDDADDFDEQTLVWNRVTRWGLFGVSGFNEDYTLNLVDASGATLLQVDGDLQRVEAAWLYPIQASFRTNWTANLTVDYTDKELTPSLGGPLLQSQKYGSVEIGTSYSHTLLVSDLPLTLGGGLAVRQGLGDDKVANPIVLADLGYLLLRPQLGVELASQDWSASFKAVLQITDDVLPEQSQWVLGGNGTLSTFLPGIAVGDSGGLARLAFEYLNLPEWRDFQLVPTVFVEYGYTEFEGQIPLLPRSNMKPEVIDAGLDIDLKWRDDISLRLTYAESLEEDDLSAAAINAADANLYFSLVIDL